MRHHLISIPYDSGHYDQRMGCGPRHLLSHGATARLGKHGTVTQETLHPQSSFATEIGSAFELHRAGASAVAGSISAGKRPIILPGNCNSAIGSVAGINHASAQGSLGIIWFDGHGDCNTPETFQGDFLDAMGLSTLTGRCWQGLVKTVPGFSPLVDENVILVGGHGADEGARHILAESRITVLPPSDQMHSLEIALQQLERQGVTRVYLHLDLDVLDANIAKANEFAPSGGLTLAVLEAWLALIARRCFIEAFCIASFDPSCDETGLVAAVALAAIDTVARSDCGQH